VCAYPALAVTIQSAAALAVEEDGGTLTAANALGWDLAQAWRLLQLGLTSNDDMRMLAQYFSKLDAMVSLQLSPFELFSLSFRLPLSCLLLLVSSVLCTLGEHTAGQ
jgi:hypothetical protein